MIQDMGLEEHKVEIYGKKIASGVRDPFSPCKEHFPKL